MVCTVENGKHVNKNIIFTTYSKIFITTHFVKKRKNLIDKDYFKNSLVLQL